SQKWSYEDICNMEFKTILNSDCYSLDEKTGLYTDLRETNAGLKYLYDNALPLKVSGIIRPNEDADTTMLTGSIGYTSDLTKYVIQHSKDSHAIKAQLDDPSTDIFTGLPFQETTSDLTNEEKNAEFHAYLDTLDAHAKATVYVQMMSIPTDEQLDASVKEAMNGMKRSDMETAMMQALTEQMGMSESDVSDYIAGMSDEEITNSFTQMMAEQVKVQYAQQVQEQMSAMKPEELTAGFQQLKASLTTEQGAAYYDAILEFSDSTYEDNLNVMGYVDLDEPSTINLYASSFENKDVITDAIEDYNQSVEEMEQIQYTDYIGLMMSSITTIINTITYVLIAFVAISLIVSSIMIGVITLISVQERTKEIGILRAIGASKREVCSMFNAETIIIGLISGILGVAVTYILCVPINVIIHSLTGINNLRAFLPIPAAVILILISVALTLLSGLIPSRSAAKKDPVVALRTE
ncbi:MAG: FtsX-like permease family protein, partial [Ruminococcus sp.]